MFILIPLVKASDASPSMAVYFSPTSAEDEASPYQVFTKFVAGAKTSLHVAAYDFNMKTLADLLVEKKRQGVYVELLLEKNNYFKLSSREALSTLAKNGIKIIKDARSGLMHNKYIVRDGKSVLTGSLNFTHNGFFHNYNDLLIIHSQDLAEAYLKNYIMLTDKYHRRKYGKNYRQITRSIKINETESVLPLFSLGVDNITDHLSREISQTRQQINFLIFAFSSRKISGYFEKQLLKQVKVRGIFDDSFETVNITKSWQAVPFQALWKKGADVKYDNEANRVHHKLMLLDKRKVITGSFNFSLNAIRNNNENLLIIDSKKLNAQYQKRFEEIWKKSPNQTEFEKYIILRNRNKTKLNYQQYLIHLMKENQKKLPKIGDDFTGKLVRINSANEMVVKLSNSGATIHFFLSGLEIPQLGIAQYHQEPQFTLTKEMVILMGAQRRVRGRVLEIRRNQYWGILTLERDNLAGLERPRTLNERILENGLAWLEESDEEKILSFAPPLWNGMKQALKKAKQAKKILWGDYALKESPEAFKNNLEKLLIKMALKEKRYCEASYRENYLIGNRKTKRVYLPYSSYHYAHLKDLTNERLIFFLNKENALLAGYEIVWDQ